METRWRYRLNDDRLIVQTRFEPENKRYVVEVKTAHDRFIRERFAPEQLEAHIQALTRQLADDAWLLDNN